MKKSILYIAFFFSFLTLFAARPTVNATNLTISNVTCISVQLSWTTGDGLARIVVARQGAAPDFSPTDLTNYAADKNFGKSTQYGTGCYIVYNGSGPNTVKIDSLKTGLTYYFTIYEHDNNGTDPLYLTSGNSVVSATTYSATLDFTVKYFDSCQQKNLYEFENKSTTTIPGATFIINFGDNTNSTSSPVMKSYTIAGSIPANVTMTPALGCRNVFVKPVRVYQKVNAYIDYSELKDSVQCLETNFFQVDPKPIISSLPASYTYNWNYDDGTPIETFKKMKKTYKKPGRYNVEVEIVTMVNLQASSCRDTLRFDVVVLPSPVGSASINDTFQCLKNNNFHFTNTDNTLTYFRWYFGDSDSSLLKSPTHTYSDTGSYKVVHVAAALTGCKGRDTVVVKVLPNLNSSFVGLDSFYCLNKQVINLIPASSNGQFDNYAVNNLNQLIINTPGNHTVRHIVGNAYCSDTTVIPFRVQDIPYPNLGKDSAICSGPSVLLDANEIGTYLWNTGESSKSINVNRTGTYIVQVTYGKCSNNDTVEVEFSTAPVIQLGKDTLLCKGATLKLNASSFNAQYQWSTGSTDSVIYAFTPGKYSVRAENPCGVAEDSIFVFFNNEYCDLFMPNAFSPDNDLLNAKFIPRGRNITVQLFEVYNRWGQKVYSTDKNNEGWDGTYMGEKAQQDLYIWKLFYTTQNGPYIKKSNAFGQVLLIR
mgnify:CR=1 FL=1